MSAKPTIRERIEHSLRYAGPDEWFTQREIAERINAKPGSIRGVILRMEKTEAVLVTGVGDRGVHNPRNGGTAQKVYRWRR